MSLLSNSKNFNKIDGNFYKSSEATIVGAKSQERSSISFKRGSFDLNGKQIIIKKDDNLHFITQKINRISSQTGVTAKIEKTSKGHKLHLFSRNSIVEIQDHSGVLAKLYNNGHIGTYGKHLIQVTPKFFSGSITVLYNKSAKNKAGSVSLVDLFPNLQTFGFAGNPLIVLNEIPADIIEEVLEEPFNALAIKMESDIMEDVVSEVYGESSQNLMNDVNAIKFKHPLEDLFEESTEIVFEKKAISSKEEDIYGAEKVKLERFDTMSTRVIDEVILLHNKQHSFLRTKDANREQKRLISVVTHKLIYSKDETIWNNYDKIAKKLAEIVLEVEPINTFKKISNFMSMDKNIDKVGVVESRLEKYLVTIA